MTVKPALGSPHPPLLASRYAVAVQVRCADSSGHAIDENEAALDVPNTRERRRRQNGLIERTAHLRDAACLVNRWANDGKIQPFAATDIAIEDFADMQTEIHVGHRLAVRPPPLFQLGDTVARGDRCGQCRAAGVGNQPQSWKIFHAFGRSRGG
jgi:hypothetical protein